MRRWSRDAVQTKYLDCYVSDVLLTFYYASAVKILQIGRVDGRNGGIRVDGEKRVLDEGIHALVFESKLESFEDFWLIEDIGVHQVPSFLTVLLIGWVALEDEMLLGLGEPAVLCRADRRIAANGLDDALDEYPSLENPDRFLRAEPALVNHYK